MPEEKKNVRTIDITPDWLPLTKWYMRVLTERGGTAKRKALAEEHMLDMAEKLDRLNKQVKDGDIVILERKEYADLLAGKKPKTGEPCAECHERGYRKPHPDCGWCVADDAV